MKQAEKIAGRHPAHWVLNAVVAAALAGASLGTSALGIGKLTVRSTLGEPLKAEIDIGAITPEELASLRGRVAPPDVFRAAGAEYPPALAGATVTLERRTDGRYYLRLTSDRSVQDPFIDMILEVEWASGRMSREFTLLFDPPLTRAVASTPTPIIMAPAPAPASAVSAAPVLLPTPVPAPLGQDPAASDTVSGRGAAVSAAPTAKPAASAASAATPGSYLVATGDTLSSIARRQLRPGVSLDQMLVALYRGNAEAFMGDNMNRLKLGARLDLPSDDAARAVSTTEAREVIRAQSADFGAFRARLAGGVPVAVPNSGRADAGQVEVRVQDRRSTAAAAPDKLTLSKGGIDTAAAGAETVVRAREQADSKARLAELSKNVDDLKKLSDVAASDGASSGLASASAPGDGVIAVPLSPPLPASDPQAPPVASEPAASSEMLAASAAPGASAAAVAASTPASAPQSVDAGQGAGLLGEVLQSPLALPVGAGLLAMLAGLGVFLRRRRSRGEDTETAFAASRLQSDVFFAASGGHRTDTREEGGLPSAMNFSHSQLDPLGDVDPVAEADVYLAYGRDLQAEEILKEAMRVAPERASVALKLMEVYAKRRDTRACEAVAATLHAITGGQGDDWAKAQQIGAAVDARNPAYRPGGKPADRSAAADSREEALHARTLQQTLPPSPARPSAASAVAAARIAEPPAAVPELSPSVPRGIDIDLDLDLDLDLGSPPPTELGRAPITLAEPSAGAESSPRAGAPLEFDLSGISLDLSLPPEPGPAADLPLTEPELLDLPMPQGSPLALTDRADEAGLTRELGHADAADEVFGGPQEGGEGGEGGEAGEGREDEALRRKLELADEFRQIGDVDGARDLLEEVIEQSRGSLRAQAEGMLRSLN